MTIKFKKKTKNNPLNFLCSYYLFLRFVMILISENNIYISAIFYEFWSSIISKNILFICYLLNFIYWIIILEWIIFTIFSVFKIYCLFNVLQYNILPSRYIAMILTFLWRIFHVLYYFWIYFVCFRVYILSQNFKLYSGTT